MKLGIARMHQKATGSTSISIDRELARAMSLPLKTKLKATWNDETKKLTIEELD